MRAAIYARYSTELQNEKSIEDQVALCRGFAAKQQLQVVATFNDAARSGASEHGRDGLKRLMDAARERAFDVVVVEALDRLSRDMADLANIYKRLTFLGIEIRGVNDGTADSILVGLRGLVGQLQREDGAKKVRRGMAGVLRDGRHPGGRAYGYRAVPGKKGELAIVEGEAAIVRRIFAEYVAGGTPRNIAGDLNREGIAPPRGTRWNASTINGNSQRGAGILQNELYAGRIVWNKVRMVKDPDTGLRISRPNPKDQWQAIDAPHLAIVDRETWERVRALKAQKAVLPSHAKRRPVHLLSGLLRCGSCGSGMSVYGLKGSRRRIRCSTQYESGTCPNRKTVYIDVIERTVLAGMREELQHPRLIEHYVRTYNAERRRLAATASTMRSKCERQLAAVRAERERTVDMVIRGVIEEGDAKARLGRLKVEQRDLAAQLAATGEPPTIIALHPAALDRYLAAVDTLAATLAEHAAATDDRGTIGAEFRALVHSVTVHPKPDGAIEVEVKGRLAALIGGSAFPEGQRTVLSRVVAEAGLEPATFGL